MQVYHPNIDLEGNICLNILREDWKPVLTISSLIYGLNFLFLVGARPLAPADGGGWGLWPRICCGARTLE